MGPSNAPYCDPPDLTNYLPATALALASPSQKTQACIDATQEADGFLRGRFELPLLAWGNDIRKYTAWIACYLLMSTIGFQPTAGSDRLIVERYYQAVGWPERPGSGWFPGIQRQSIHPDVTPSVPSPGNATYDLPQVRTSPQRGWQQCRGGKPVIG